MSAWTHALCAACWEAHNPGRPAVKLRGDLPEEPCCACGAKTRDGIYIRKDPHFLRCQGVHPEVSP